MRVPFAGVRVRAWAVGLLAAAGRVRALLFFFSLLAIAAQASAQGALEDEEYAPLYRSGPASIDGDPATLVEIASVYAFQPVANIVTTFEPYFEIRNQPPWTMFDELTGVLSGTPAAADEGWYPHIRICITDGTSKACLPDFSITVASPLPPRTATLSWQRPARNEDGSAFTDLLGYLIYAGRTPDQLVPMVSVPAPSEPFFVFDALEPGDHYFAVSTLSASGGESVLSEIIQKKID